MFSHKFRSNKKFQKDGDVIFRSNKNFQKDGEVIFLQHGRQKSRRGLSENEGYYVELSFKVCKTFTYV
jgi:hypothetical protein